jgi:hypothetical protein
VLEKTAFGSSFIPVPTSSVADAEMPAIAS